MTHGYGIIMDVRDCHDRHEYYDAFTELDIYQNRSEYREKVIELFKQYLEDIDHADAGFDIEFKDYEDHEMFSEFCEHFFHFDTF